MESTKIRTQIQETRPNPPAAPEGGCRRVAKSRAGTCRGGHFAHLAGRDLSEFYEGGLEKGGFSKLNLRKVRRRPGGGRVDEH